MIAGQLADFLGPERVLLIGEHPGTVEYPALVREVAELVVARGQRVIVGLEVPLTEDVDMPAFGAFFHRPDELLDGRSSEAMAELIEALVALDGATTVAMDGPWVGPGAPVPLEHLGLLDQPRDAVMAGRLLAEIDRDPRRATIVLAGSEHTRIDRGQQTLGGLISPWFPRLASLQTLTPAGTAWTLTRDGPGEREVAGAPDLPVGAEWADAVGPDGFHGYVNLGPVSASPPLNHIN